MQIADESERGANYGVITVTQENSKRIIVTFSYDTQLVEKVKTIDGRKWHKDKKCWSFPNTDGTLGKILKAFEGEEIRIDPVLQHQKPVIAMPKLRQKQSPYIQELLGHKDSKTTEIYTHVSTKSLSKIQSPLDNLDLTKGGNE